jgi:CO dehydrogenase/acetyl-CoA synthase gamma subunit (corrinoid Fe-S protein)
LKAAREAAMMAVAVELVIMKVALEDCPVLLQPDFAASRVALAILLE